MAEAGLSSHSVYIVVTPESGQYPITEVPIVPAVPELKQEENVPSTNPPPPEAYSIQPRRIRCPECQRYTAETEEKMLRHIRKQHRGENPFQCYMCDYSTYNKVLFEEHVRIHQGIKPYKCAHCPYRSVSKKNTKKHELIHRPDNPHKCDQCGFIARHAKGLLHHKASHTFDGQKRCAMCNEIFRSMQLYRNHASCKTKCNICSKRFCQAVYKQHRLQAHGNARNKRKVSSAPKIKPPLFTCAICKWEGNTKPRILLHLIHHPKQVVDERVVSTNILRRLGIMEEQCEVLE